MTMTKFLAAFLFTAALPLASCGAQTVGDSAATAASDAAERPFAVTAHGSFNEPWAAAFAPGTSVLFVTEKPGTMQFVDVSTGKRGTVSGLPTVDYGGQGGLGDVAFLPGESAATVGQRTIYLTWAKAGPGDTRGAALGKGTLVCDKPESCRIDGLKVIWEQKPKVTGRGHYSHRIAIAPNGQTMFVASGERQKGEPAQDPQSDLGKIVHLNLDGTPAAVNPLAEDNVARPEIWSLGHRNILGLQFDASGQLWDLEHGPAGGDELNRVVAGKNYGWPVVSNGDHYNGTPIPRHDTRPEFAAPAISWNPVIAPGDFIFYSGDLFPQWKGAAVIAAMKPAGLVVVQTEGDTAKEVARYPFDKRIREVVQGPDGAIWLLEDKAGGRLLELRPR
ncbi:PQQ-dependent sugar dehydrogenase [Tsuneonella suprasediminis]|uniref:PQQ-dependent sugar dehydrogenase n=1 Tax=Tsuneonella suprasediminis TaxID=2306996 RepID=A0A419QYP7_9SPHN|nr:PQQ-dependent sugar dehydrogenase [Tsuneonella suprasediminis]RJX65938.1 PQQ-dependent sugar dehydrogenase [Tsuneonella suprasediminis]